MRYRPIQIAGYSDEVSPEPILDDTDSCLVHLSLSDTPPTGWREMFLELLRSQGSNGKESGGVEPTRERVELTGLVIRLTTSGDVIQDDIERLRRAVASANAEFERVYQATLRSQRQIATILEWEFPPPGEEGYHAATPAPIKRHLAITRPQEEEVEDQPATDDAPGSLSE